MSRSIPRQAASTRSAPMRRIALGISQKSIIADGVNTGKQARRVHTVGLIHQALTGSLGKALGNHGAAHHRGNPLEQIVRNGVGHLRQVALAAVQNAVFKGVDAVAKFGHLGVMRNHNHGNAAGVAERTKIVHDQAAGLGIQRARGFVGQQNARIVDHGAGNGHALLLTARKAVAAVVHAGREPHQLKGADNTFPAFFWRNFFKYQRKFNIFKHCGVVEKVARLHDKAHGATPKAGCLLTVERQHILAENFQRTGIGRV